MLFLHETHEVKGRSEDEFEAAFREEWAPRLARTDDARLLYFAHRAHGSGPSYHVVTLTALRDGTAYESLIRAVDAGELRETAVALDALRYDVTGKLLIPLPWSPLQTVDLDRVPAAAKPHELALFMEDTMWPHQGQLEHYVERSGSYYAAEMREREGGRGLLSIQAAFRTAFGSHLRREVVLWQKVIRPEGLLALLRTEVPAEYRKPGTWMHDALDLRDRWESRLLRTSAWSPLG